MQCALLYTSLSYLCNQYIGKNNLELKICTLTQIHLLLYSLGQCFPTFFGSRHPNVEMNMFGGTPSWFNRHTYRAVVLNLFELAAH